MNQSKITVYRTALALFIVANVLELFIPRMDEGNYFVRMPIQLINGGLLVLMWATLLNNRNHWTPVTKITLVVILMILVYTAGYLMNNQMEVSAYAAYIRFLLWTTSLIFFYEMMLKYGIDNKLMCIYILTFVAGVAKKLFETPVTELDNLGAGDTAALPLLFITPIILVCFSDKTKMLILSVVAVLILISLRRTVILGFAISFPFIYKYISAKLKTHHLVLLSFAFMLAIYFAWGYIGEALIFRFENLLVGDGGGAKDSYGSGRSEFYMIVLNGWFNSDLPAMIYGHGLIDIAELLSRTYGITHAHNDILEIGYTFGFIGIGVWFTFLGRLWGLRNEMRRYVPENTNLFYVAFISYLIIGLASGCILRITTMPLAFSIAILVYQVQTAKYAKAVQPETDAQIKSEDYVPV
ncbi:O-antigen ligase family protein [Adhaeribacter soli]|uniref:O-antigen ligase family protein n=1 Tax=Adhaeribacter soli TaxID=2607655 RepID=A0A5N1J1P9_9BACT|nr:O-antigen ligase family protein [Adhaeribacter soli]KAA9340713.1 O-antigen ligase family protein [Adhaeribacter soli]